MVMHAEMPLNILNHWIRMSFSSLSRQKSCTFKIHHETTQSWHGSVFLKPLDVDVIVVGVQLS